MDMIRSRQGGSVEILFQMMIKTNRNSILLQSVLSFQIFSIPDLMNPFKPVSHLS